MKVLVTGGAGFIGSHITDALVSKGHDVIVLDSLDQQVHAKGKPEYLNDKAEFMRGDVRNREHVMEALEGCEIVYHEAAAVGVGQSMYQIEKYMDVNTRGTAALLDVLVNKEHSVKKLIVASSMSTYGEGVYECENCGIVYPHLRSGAQLEKRQWELLCSCGATLKPMPTPESKPQLPTSVYALSKKDQEDMCLMVGKTYSIPTIAFRYFNVYGPRQSLSNPYTGVAAIFMSRLKNNSQPVIYEDGLQSRDFINVKDVADANIFAIKNNRMNYEVFNLGSGHAVTIKEIAEKLAQLYGKKIEPVVTNKYRKGDIRHCFADISKIKGMGWAPKIAFEDGISELARWSEQACAEDKFEAASKELEAKGLVEQTNSF